MRDCDAPNASAKVAQKRIKAGDFCVNGTVTREPKQQLIPGIEDITLAATGATVPSGCHSFLIMHKPKGCVCQRHPREENIYNLVPQTLKREDLGCVGRLDRDTTGTLLLTTDGGLQSMLLFPTSRVWKTYHATIDKPTCELRTDAVEAFQQGLLLEDGTKCAPATLRMHAANPHEVTVVLHEGFFHQVKRMLASVGGTVVALHRQRFGELDASDLIPGAVRPLTHEELTRLTDMLPLDRVAHKELGWQRHTSPQESRTGDSSAVVLPASQQGVPLECPRKRTRE